MDKSKAKKKTAKKKIAKKKTAKKPAKKNELQPVTKKEIAAPLSADPAIAMIQVMERAVLNPEVDVDKMERIMDMQLKVIERNAEIEFNQAMAIVQSEVGFISADLDNNQTHSRYASYAQMNRALRPIYTKHNFALSFNSEPRKEKDMMSVICYVTHKAGHTRKYEIDLPADGKGPKGNDVMTKIHAAGAASSYGMRYLLKMIFNISVGEDDTDGNMPEAVQVEYITENQINELDSKIKENGVSMSGLLTWMKRELKIKSLETIPHNFYDYVNNQIDKVIKNKAA